MHCPFCNAADSKVIDSRLAAEGCQIRRRRECVVCGERFTTFESYEVVMPRVIKSFFFSIFFNSIRKILFVIF